MSDNTIFDLSAAQIQTAIHVLKPAFKKVSHLPANNMICLSITSDKAVFKAINACEMLVYSCDQENDVDEISCLVSFQHLNKIGLLKGKDIRLTMNDESSLITVQASDPDLDSSVLQIPFTDTDAFPESLEVLHEPCVLCTNPSLFIKQLKTLKNFIDPSSATNLRFINLTTENNAFVLYATDARMAIRMKADDTIIFEPTVVNREQSQSILLNCTATQASELGMEEISALEISAKDNLSEIQVHTNDACYSNVLIRCINKYPNMSILFPSETIAPLLKPKDLGHHFIVNHHEISEALSKVLSFTTDKLVSLKLGQHLEFSGRDLLEGQFSTKVFVEKVCGEDKTFDVNVQLLAIALKAMTSVEDSELPVHIFTLKERPNFFYIRTGTDIVVCLALVLRPAG